MCLNKRKEIYKKIIALAYKQNKISKREMEDSKQYGTGKKSAYQDGRQGVYFLYGKNDEIIYVGKVGTGKYTSLYHRMVGNGNGSHKKQQWYNEVEYCKYLPLKNCSDEDIEIIERICIQLNPNINNYNDKYCSSNDLEKILEKIK